MQSKRREEMRKQLGSSGCSCSKIVIKVVGMQIVVVIVVVIFVQIVMVTQIVGTVVVVYS